MLDSSIVLAEYKADEALNTQQLEKQLHTLREVMGMPVALVAYNLSAQERKRLIQKGINFVVPGKQLFLPELLVDLREHFPRKKEKKDSLTPSSQALLLYHILHRNEKIENLSFKELAQKFGYTQMAITKIADDLGHNELCTIEGTKEKYIHFHGPIPELWHMARPVLVSPVIKRVYTDTLPPHFLMRCNESALPEYTEMAHNNQEYRAIEKIISLVPSTSLNRILAGKRLLTYTDYVKEDHADFNHAFPVINHELRKALGMAKPTVAEPNRYVKHFKYIKGFYNKFLNTNEFRTQIPIQNRFLPVNQKSVCCIHQKTHGLQFIKNGNQAEKDGVEALAPYRRSPHPNLQMFFIAARQHHHLIDTVKQYFFKGHGWFPGINKFAHLNIHPQKELDIVFDDAANPLPEITDALDAHATYWQGAVTYIAVFITPYDRYDPDLE